MEHLRSLRCCLCKKVLSVPPFVTLTDGSNVCGRCDVPPNCSIAGRNLLAEILFREQAKIPCSHDGCTQTMKQDEVMKHEEICYMRPYKCVVGNCNWLSRIELLPDHVKDQHQDSYFENIENLTFDINIKENCSFIKIGTMIVNVNYPSSSSSSSSTSKTSSKNEDTRKSFDLICKFDYDSYARFIKCNAYGISMFDKSYDYYYQLILMNNKSETLFESRKSTLPSYRDYYNIPLDLQAIQIKHVPFVVAGDKTVCKVVVFEEKKKEKSNTNNFMTQNLSRFFAP